MRANRAAISTIIPKRGIIGHPSNFTLDYRKRGVEMGKASELGLEVRSFLVGKPAFLAGVIDALDIPRFFDEAYAAKKVVGRYPDLSPGTVAKLFLINISHQHHPLYRIKEYFVDKDVPLLAGKDISLNALTDDRFGDLLDQMHSWGPRSLFTTIATHAFFKYGLSIRSLNYDTTSKIMWGTYKAEDGQVGTISITIGHSKDKREDKNQLKIGLGTADGVIADAKVLSGNTDDKTFNNDALDDVDAILKQHNVDRSDFYYVADAALFTQENIKKAHKHKLFFITRMPETVGIANELIDKAWSSPKSFETVELTNSQGKTIYHVQEFTSEYKDYPVKCAVCHSPALEEKKRHTIAKKVQKESVQFEKLAKTYQKRTFACEADASKEVSVLTNKVLKKVKYHTLSFTIVQEAKKRRGRPPKDPSAIVPEYFYKLIWHIQKDPSLVEQAVKNESTFVLTSNDLKLSAEGMLVEYKTQSSVEKKFQQLKSPHFVNALYLDKPERIEALVYLILIAMMMLSVVERVVRREMELESATVIGPGSVVMKRPSLRAITDIFNYVPVNRETYQQQISREFTEPLNDSQIKILRYLHLQPSIFTDGPVHPAP